MLPTTTKFGWINRNSQVMIWGRPCPSWELQTWGGLLISSNMYWFFFFSSRKIDWYSKHIHILRLWYFFSSLSMNFSDTTIHFSAGIIFFNNPLPPTPLKGTVMLLNVCKHKFTCTNVTPKKKKKKEMEGSLHLMHLAAYEWKEHVGLYLYCFGLLLFFLKELTFGSTIEKDLILTAPCYRDYNHKVWTVKQVQSRSDDSGATMHIVRVSNMGRIVDFFKQALFFFFFTHNRLIFQAYIYILRTSFHEFCWHENTFFSSYKFF